MAQQTSKIEREKNLNHFIEAGHRAHANERLGPDRERFLMLLATALQDAE